MGGCSCSWRQTGIRIEIGKVHDHGCGLGHYGSVGQDHRRNLLHGVDPLKLGRLMLTLRRVEVDQSIGCRGFGECGFDGKATGISTSIKYNSHVFALDASAFPQRDMHAVHFLGESHNDILRTPGHAYCDRGIGEGAGRL